jgi:general nucleoside transport system permease protein
MELTLVVFFASIGAMAAPLIFAALGETLSEKAGVVNLSLDGTILLGAMAGFAVTSRTESLFLGFVVAGFAGCMAAALLAVIGVWLKQSQVAVGFALTFLCRDLAYFLGNPFARIHGPQLTSTPIPFLADIPFLGKVLFSHSLIVYLSFLAIPLCLYFLYHTRFGLILRMAGENPEGCWARGINPVTVRIYATLTGGVFAGLAGAAYSLAVKPGWGQPQGCEGIGWIALALVIFGGWHPLRVVIGAYLFGILQLLGIHFQDLFPLVPAQIFQVAPFPLMIFTLVLIHLTKKSKGRLFRILGGQPPKWLGRPYGQS